MYSGATRSHLGLIELNLAEELVHVGVIIKIFLSLRNFCLFDSSTASPHINFNLITPPKRMTEEFWQKWKSGRDERHGNQIWKGMERSMRDEAIKERHPDELYSICRTDNNYLRHYRASTKLSIDELSMFICRDVGCDLMYCQHLVGKPRNSSQ